VAITIADTLSFPPTPGTWKFWRPTSARNALAIAERAVYSGRSMAASATNSWPRTFSRPKAGPQQIPPAAIRQDDQLRADESDQQRVRRKDGRYFLQMNVLIYSPKSAAANWCSISIRF